MKKAEKTGVGRVASKAMRKPQKPKRREIRALGASALSNTADKRKAEGPAEG